MLGIKYIFKNCDRYINVNFNFNIKNLKINMSRDALKI